ncbi:MAG: hypothetical protein SOY70_00405 [Veillonellaceae bacterium]|nr:hypothetical protein [Veillonellaceae bacterium]
MQNTTTTLNEPMTELTLREAKQTLTHLINNYDPNQPITLELKQNGVQQIFSLVPKHTRRNSHGEAFTIKDLPFDQLQTMKEPGTYVAIDTFSLNPDKSNPFVYGLYIDYDGNRDLRFFNDRPAAEKWLKKKIKLLEK